MKLTDLLAVGRISLDSTGQGLVDGDAVLSEIARLLAGTDDADKGTILRKLQERERLQSTGIGDGVAIPHTAIEEVPRQRAALVLCPQGVAFHSIDQQPVSIFFGVIGPKSEASAHLKVLAKISRLLRSPETRRRLLESKQAEEAYSLIEEHDGPSVEP
jgi:PTS system nitrogen regulatory IIA component